jgi:methanogenesis imperfect marker protein 11
MTEEQHERKDNDEKDEFWVSPYQRIIGLVDNKKRIAQVYEYNSRAVCGGASAWVAYHYPRTSEIIIDAAADSSRNILTMKLGKGNLNLEPSVSPAGIESAEVSGRSLRLTYAGLAGGGVGAAKCRVLAENVEGVEILSEAGGSKLGRAVLSLPVMMKVHIGIDDTDTTETGATWSLANEIGWHASQITGIVYLSHTIVQLFPQAPGKTKNCVSTVLTFGVLPDFKSDLVKFVSDKLKATTYSDNTAMAVFEGIIIPDSLRTFSDKCRTEVVTETETEELAKLSDVTIIEITGRSGMIGAVAALGYSEDNTEAVKIPPTGT